MVTKPGQSEQSGQASQLLTQSEAAAIAQVPVKAVYKTVADRLPKASLVRRA